MPRTLEFDEKYRKSFGSTYPRLNFSKDEKGTKIRLLVIDPTPAFEYIHNVKAPKIVDGGPVWEERKNKQGEIIGSDYKMDFLQRAICLGDASHLDEDGIDPKNCPMCAEARESDMMDMPTRRFVVHVLEYATKSGSHDVGKPFRVDVKLWGFGEKVYNELLDVSKESGPLQDHDLLLTVENPTFQGVDIKASAKAAWQATDETRALALETYKENKAEEDDVLHVIGRTATQEQAKDLVRQVKGRWKTATTGEDHRSSKNEARSLDEGIDDLLTAQTGSSTVQEASSDFDPFNSTLEDQHKEIEKQQSIGKPQSSGEKLTTDDLDALLEL